MLGTMNNSRGFTILEMCISLIIIGVIAAPLLMIYGNYQVEMKERKTYENVHAAVESLQQFRNVHARYPCPGPLNLPRNDPAYGHEGDCTDDAPPGPGGDNPPMTLAPGGCGSGFCVESSVRGGLANGRVIVGALPFRALQMEEKAASDAYGGRLVYAVTESMTDAATINDSMGGIAIRDANSTPLTDPDGSAGYIVISHGPNQTGAYDKGGVLIEACAGGALETENCNEGFETGASFSSSSIYVSAFRSKGVADQYDDTALYYSRTKEALWKRTSGNPEDIHDLSKAFTGIGTDDPEVALDIISPDADTDSLGVFDYSSTGGKIMVDRICDPTDPDNPQNCFSPSDLIMDCTDPDAPNKYMVGIGGGGPLCAPIEFLCPESAPVFAGRDGNKPDCRTVPACNPMAVSICGPNDDGLPTAPEGYDTWLGPRGACREEEWECTNTGWQRTDTRGECTFTPTEWDVTGIECDDPFSGTYTARYRSICGGGSQQISNTAADDCYCDVPETTVRWREDGTCSGYEIDDPVEGRPEYEQVFNENSCRWERSGNERGGCICNPPAQMVEWHNWGSCDSGYDGTVQRKREFDTEDCRWRWTDDYQDNCTCNTDSRTYEKNHVCDNPTCEDPNPLNKDEFEVYIDPGTCKEITPHTQIHVGSCKAKSFQWVIFEPAGNAQSIPGDAIYVGDGCTCADHEATKISPETCYVRGDPSLPKYRCRCQ